MSFIDRMELASRILPYIRRRPDFALKGGTAINLFFRRDLPRLSVDIDLVYLPITSYDKARNSIHQQLKMIAQDIRSDTTPQRRINVPGKPSEKHLRILFRHHGHQVKVEVAPVARGTVWPPEVQCVESPRFGYLESNVASFEDVYAGNHGCSPVLLPDLESREKRQLSRVVEWESQTMSYTRKKRETA